MRTDTHKINTIRSDPVPTSITLVVAVIRPVDRRRGAVMTITGIDKQHAMLMVATDRQLSSSAKSVGCILLDHTNLETGVAWPSTNLIAVESECSDRTVRRALTELKKNGWITYRRHGGPGNTNLYTFNWQHYWATKEAYNLRQEEFRNRYNEADAPASETVSAELSSATQFDADPDNFVREPGQHCPVHPDNVVPQTLTVIPLEPLTPERLENDANPTAKGEEFGVDDLTLNAGKDDSNNEHAADPEFAWHASERDAVAMRTPNHRRQANLPSFQKLTPSSAEVAKQKAEHRLNKQLVDRYRGTSKLAIALTVYTDELQSKAVAAELIRQGAGAALMFEQIEYASRDTARMRNHD